jgi:hypothetical protein
MVFADLYERIMAVRCTLFMWWEQKFLGSRERSAGSWGKT